MFNPTNSRAAFSLSQLSRRTMSIQGISFRGCSTSVVSESSSTGTILCSSTVHEMRRSITKTAAVSLRSLDRFYRSQISPYVNRVGTLTVAALVSCVNACVYAFRVCVCVCVCISLFVSMYVGYEHRYVIGPRTRYIL